MLSTLAGRAGAGQGRWSRIRGADRLVDAGGARWRAGGHAAAVPTGSPASRHSSIPSTGRRAVRPWAWAASPRRGRARSRRHGSTRRPPRRAAARPTGRPGCPGNRRRAGDVPGGVFLRRAHVEHDDLADASGIRTATGRRRPHRRVRPVCLGAHVRNPPHRPRSSPRPACDHCTHAGPTRRRPAGGQDMTSGPTRPRRNPPILP